MKSDDFAQHLHDWPAKPIPVSLFDSFAPAYHALRAAFWQSTAHLPRCLVVYIFCDRTGIFDMKVCRQMVAIVNSHNDPVKPRQLRHARAVS